ncbi:MAG TPA: hypothetical protein VIY51_17850 [Xanthobacteraceae bacterium]
MIVRTIAAVALAAACGGCWSSPYEYPGAEYLHRSDTITLSAGNAKDINAATHIIDPWPRHAYNRRIPANGERMAHAMERYKSGAQTPGASNQSGPQVIGIPVGSATPSQGPGSSGAPGQ